MSNTNPNHPEPDRLFVIGPSGDCELTYPLLDWADDEPNPDRLRALPGITYLDTTVVTCDPGPPAVLYRYLDGELYGSCEIVALDDDPDGIVSYPWWAEEWLSEWGAWLTWVTDQKSVR